MVPMTIQIATFVSSVATKDFSHEMLPVSPMLALLLN